MQADLFQALSNPTRIRIIALLLERDRLVSEMLTILELSPSTLSSHLGTLRRVQLVQSQRDTGSMRYELNCPEHTRTLLTVARDLLHTIVKG